LPLPLRDEAHYDRMGVNTRMCDPKDVEGIHLRRLDGADTWDLLDWASAPALQPEENHV